MTAQESIDARILSYYGELFDEGARLTTRSAQSPVEFARTQEIILERISAGRVLDIGGGAGVHARALQSAGFEVEVIDPVRRHVDQARAAGLSARIGDARALPFQDAEFDAALVLGPLYHLAAREDRQLALREAARVVRPDGLIFAAGLSRFIAFGKTTLARGIPDPYPDEWVAVAARGEPASGMRFPAGHFHAAEELDEEVRSSGLEVEAVLGVEGPAGSLLESLEGAGEELVQAALTVARAAASVPGVRDMSAHLIAVARVRS